MTHDRRQGVPPLEVHIHYHDSSEPHTSLAEAVLSQLQTIERKVDNIMATEAQFVAKLKRIDDNTTKSAAAAAAIAAKVTALKEQLDQVLTDAGVPGAVEENILAQLDTMGNTTEALSTFLEQTASTPAPAPEPEPVPTPPV